MFDLGNDMVGELVFEGNPNKMEKAFLASEFMELYNEFCAKVNPKYRHWNAIWKRMPINDKRENFGNDLDVAYNRYISKRANLEIVSGINIYHGFPWKSELYMIEDEGVCGTRLKKDRTKTCSLVVKMK